MKHSCLALAVTLAAWGAAPRGAAADFYTTVGLGANVNDRLQFNHPDYPSGSPVILGGVPFDIPTVPEGSNNYYNTAVASGGGPGTITAVFPINLSGVSGIHTLINTYFGEGGAVTLASLTFTFDDATTFVKDLYGNFDIRDFYQNVFTNGINNTTTVNVFTTDTDGPVGPNPYRLDKQFIDLTPFAGKTLVSMTLTDMGGPGVQRTFLSGITAQQLEAVPEPSSFIVLGIGLLGLIAYRRRSA
jgi:hypothetical protein